jgi:FeS assembly protein IscX
MENMMNLKWVDIQEIVDELDAKYPEVNPLQINFKELYDWILALEDFDDDPKHCGERILEAVQQTWIEERQ